MVLSTARSTFSPSGRNQCQLDDMHLCHFQALDLLSASFVGHSSKRPGDVSSTACRADFTGRGASETSWARDLCAPRASSMLVGRPALGALLRRLSTAFSKDQEACFPSGPAQRQMGDSSLSRLEACKLFRGCRRQEVARTYSSRRSRRQAGFHHLPSQSQARFGAPSKRCLVAIGVRARASFADPCLSWDLGVDDDSAARRRILRSFVLVTSRSFHGLSSRDS